MYKIGFFIQFCQIKPILNTPGAIKWQKQQISKQKLLISGKSTLRYILRRTIRGPGAKTRQLRFGLEQKHVNYVFVKYG